MTKLAKTAVVLGVAGLVAATPFACTQDQGETLLTGYVEAEFVYVAAPDTGWLVDAPLGEGAEIGKGDLLFALDDDRQLAERIEAAERLKQAEAQARDMATGARREEIAALEAQLKEAKAALDLAEQEHERWMTLVGRGVASRARAEQVTAEFEAATARVETVRANIDVARLAAREAARDAASAARDAAAASLAQAEWRLGQRTVEARVDGRVEDVFRRQGEFVTAGAPVLALLPPGAIKVRFFVAEAQLPAVEIGGEVEILADGLPEPRAARITHIAREAEFTPPVIYSRDAREKLVFLVEAKPEDPAGLRPGQPVDVRLP